MRFRLIATAGGRPAPLCGLRENGLRTRPAAGVDRRRINSQSLKDGFYDKIDNLKGVRNTYIAGEILSFSNIARLMGNAVSVAERIKESRLV